MWDFRCIGPSSFDCVYNFSQASSQHKYTVTSHQAYDNIHTVLRCPAWLGLGCPRKCYTYFRRNTEFFEKAYGIPPDSAEFRGIFTVKYPRNSAEFRGIPSVFVYGIPQVTKWSRFQISIRIKKNFLNKLYWILVFNANKLVTEYSSEGLINLYFWYIQYR